MSKHQEEERRSRSGPIEVFYSYAPEDDALREQLDKHLVVMKRDGVFDAWHQRRIGAGQEWRGTIDEHLKAARVILLLVSADFLASDYCWDVEMAQALARHDAGDALVIPILLRACDWKGARFARLRALPGNETPVTSWRNQDEAWESVAVGISEALIARVARGGPLVTEGLQPDLRDRQLRNDLVAARARKARLAQHGQSTADIDREILHKRRALRAGGQLHEGDTLGDGRYVLLRRLGTGGFGVVWEAHDEVRDERVAIKVLHPDLTREATRVERFFRGARTMAELEHEAVVRILERQGEDDGWHYFVMEFVPGTDFRRAVLEHRLDQWQVIGIVQRMGEALGAAHAKGLIHRDVKPANILLDAAGVPRLTDFDLVGAADTTGGTRTGAMGTFVYAAPELMDRPQDADARVDVYGLGMTMVFGLYGRELPMTMMRQGNRVIEGLSCSPRMRAALRKAVEWERDERFRSMAVFCEELRQAVTTRRLGTEQSSLNLGGAFLAEPHEAGADENAPKTHASKPLWEHRILPSGALLAALISLRDVDKLPDQPQRFLQGAERFKQRALVPFTILEPLILAHTGSRRPALRPCPCAVDALQAKAESVNHAYTLITQAFQPTRRSKVGNVFREVVVKRHDDWMPLEDLRKDVEAKVAAGR
jgi:eukaryotic-like serine/threonine-protein kinase